MSFNRIAVYGYRGWASSAVVAALIDSGAPIKVLYQPGPDISSIPARSPRLPATWTIKTIIVRVGVVGCGEITQVAHLPTLGFLSNYFQVTYLCDISGQALAYCQNKVIGGKPKITSSAEKLASSPDVDVVLIANSDVFHVAHAVIALQNNKTVLVEKPMALSLKDADTVIETENKSSENVMVGYMRRYASAFTDTIKEIGGLDKILYARVRDIVGPNSIFVRQLGTFPKTFSDYRAVDSNELAKRTL